MATPIWRAIGGVLQAPIGVASSAIATLTPVLRPAPLPCQLPSKAPTLAAPSTPEQVDAVLSSLSERAPVWASMSFAERAALLRASIKTAVRVRERERSEARFVPFFFFHRRTDDRLFFRATLAQKTKTPPPKKKKKLEPTRSPSPPPRPPSTPRAPTAWASERSGSGGCP